mmetsp:Transcript_10835/g.30727  ORF Transcript_10835/g.30727 Transcript_10835/m.30727 type:complete len:306 (+) Transcript_10835:53-970(+)
MSGSSRLSISKPEAGLPGCPVGQSRSPASGPTASLPPFLCSISCERAGPLPCLAPSPSTGRCGCEGSPLHAKTGHPLPPATNSLPLAKPLHRQPPNPGYVCEPGNWSSSAEGGGGRLHLPRAALLVHAQAAPGGAVGIAVGVRDSLEPAPKLVGGLLPPQHRRVALQQGCHQLWWLVHKLHPELPHPCADQRVDVVDAGLGLGVEDRVAAAHVRQDKMVLPFAVPQVHGVELAGVATVTVAVAGAEEAAEHAVLHVEDGEVLVEDDLECSAPLPESLCHCSNLLGVEVVRRCEPLEATAKEGISR